MALAPLDWQQWHAQLAELLRRIERENEIFYFERNANRAYYERTIDVLVGIHSLMTPERIALADGRVMEFKNADLEHEMLYALCKEIRAIPDRLRGITTAATPAQLSP